ncbi:MAG: hypothetical protein AB7P00_34435, partial [Sandaracinaceae bacterium]
GLLFCWGDNAGGQIGNGAVGPPTLLPSAVGAASWLEIAPGGNHTCGIQSSGAVYCWGQNAQGQLGNGSTAPSPVPTRVCVL